MPRHSSGQPGAMVTDRDRQRTWGVGRVFAILTACALLIGLGYLMAANAALPISQGLPRGRGRNRRPRSRGAVDPRKVSSLPGDCLERSVELVADPVGRELDARRQMEILGHHLLEHGAAKTRRVG